MRGAFFKVVGEMIIDAIDAIDTIDTIDAIVL
jgi:hypothetical protein